MFPENIIKNFNKSINEGYLVSVEKYVVLNDRLLELFWVEQEYVKETLKKYIEYITGEVYKI